MFTEHEMTEPYREQHERIISSFESQIVEVKAVSAPYLSRPAFSLVLSS